MQNLRTMGWVLTFIGLPTVVGCREPAIVETTVDDTDNQQALANARQVEPGPGPSITIDDLADMLPENRRDRWLTIDKIADDAPGGWATGAFMPGNKVVVETQNVRQFSLDLDAIPIDWKRRVILRIDGRSSELTRKHFPELHLRRSSSGGWIPVDDQGDVHPN